MINWKKVEAQIASFIVEGINKVQEQQLQVMNSLLVKVDYVTAAALLMIDNPASVYDQDADGYIVVADTEIDEWKKDFNGIPGLSEESFHENVLNCLRPIINSVEEKPGFESLNPTLPFSVDFVMNGFPDEELIQLGAPLTGEGNEPDVLREVMHQNLQKASCETNPNIHEAMEKAHEQMKAVYANIPGMENVQMPNIQELMGQAVDNLIDCVDEGEGADWSIICSPENNTTQEQKRALALGAVMKVARNEYVDTILSGNTNLMEQQEAFAQQWNVNDRDSALSVLEWLETEGHRKIYSTIKDMMESYPWYEMVYKIIETMPGKFHAESEAEAEEITGKAISFYYNMKQALRTNKKNQGYYQNYPETIASWDLGRLVNLACWCSECGYVSEEEAWGYISFADAESRKYYTSWEEYGESYLFGRNVWNIDSIIEDPMREIFEFLKTSPESPWVKHVFN